MDDRNDVTEPPTDDPNASSDAPFPKIDVDADPDGEEMDNVEESVERAAW